jgi:hypothetical protein
MEALNKSAYEEITAKCQQEEREKRKSIADMSQTTSNRKNQNKNTYANKKLRRS